MTQAATADTLQGNYTYWIDNDIQNAKTAQTATGNLSNEIDIAGYAPGLHTLNIRMKAKDCSYKYYSYKFYIAPSEKPDTTPEAEASLIGYKYGFNESVTNVKLDNLKEITFTNTLFDIPAPTEFAKVEDGKFSIDKASSTVKMSRESELNFSMQFQGSNRQWSNILHKDTVITDNISKQAVELKPYSSISLNKIGRGDFHAVKFTIDKANTYYLVSSKASRIALYNEDGAEMQRFSETDTQQGKATYFNTGTYYAVVYNLRSNTSLRLSDKQNAMPTPVINYKDEMLSISCTDADAKIYYTLDGTEPTTQSQKYDKAIDIQHNGTIKALTAMDGHITSATATFVISDMQAAAPVMSIVDDKLVISCSTPGAVIHYEIGEDKEPSESSPIYTEPIEVTENMTVKAIAFAKDFNNSDVAIFSPYVCKVPTFTVANNLLTIASETEGAEIYYTNDGTTPTEKSQKYTGPIGLNRNATYKAIAVKDGLLVSVVNSYTVDHFKATEPTCTFADGKLTISSNMAGAVIHYEIGGSTPTSSSTIYTDALTLTDNRPVKAMVTAEGFNSSEVMTYVPDYFACEPVKEASYNGRIVKLDVPTEDAAIYYTTDGTEPNDASLRYDAETGIQIDTLCTVKAIAMKQWLNPSKVASYTPAYCYNGKTASLTEAGNLAKAMEWCNGEPAGNTLQVVGSLNAEDIALIASFEKLQHLDLAKANIKGSTEGGKAVGDNTLADQAFANMNLKTVSLPASLTACGKQLFSNNRKLAAVTWNANINIAAEVLDGINNPNLLLYVNAKSFAPATLKNVVAAGVAESITLSDIADGEASDGAFFCPSAFVAKKITYTRNFQQATVIGTSEGNETISLPFDVQEMTHETNGKIAPFAKGLPTSKAKPFWLYDLSQGAATFTRAADIQAYKPYIICMPNSEYYSDEYILAGKVTFSAENATIAVTRNEVESNGQKDFVSNFEQLSQQDGVYALNVGEAYQDYKPGSVFVSEAFVVHPFQAYIQNVTTTASRCLAVFDEATTAIESIPMKQVAGLEAWSVGKTLYIHSDITRWVNIFSTKGMLIKTVKIAAGETESIESLPSGVYIVNQKKIAIK